MSIGAIIPAMVWTARSLFLCDSLVDLHIKYCSVIHPLNRQKVNGRYTLNQRLIHLL